MVELQENENLHEQLAAAESARKAAMHEMKEVAEQCEAAKHAAVKLENSEQALRARVQELESSVSAGGAQTTPQFTLFIKSPRVHALRIVGAQVIVAL